MALVLLLQVLTIVAMILRSPNVVLFGDVYYFETEPMQPRELVTEGGLRLNIGLEKPYGGVLKLRPYTPVSDWLFIDTILPKRTNSDDAIWVNWDQEQHHRLTFFECSSEKAKEIERELRMRALENGTAKHPLYVKVHLRNNNIVRVMDVYVPEPEE